MVVKSLLRRCAVVALLLAGLALFETWYGIGLVPVQADEHPFDLRCYDWRAGNEWRHLVEVSEGDSFVVNTSYNHHSFLKSFWVTWQTIEDGTATAESDFDVHHRDKQKRTSTGDMNHTFGTVEDELYEGDESYSAGYWEADASGGHDFDARNYCLVHIIDDDSLVSWSARFISTPADGQTYRAGEWIEFEVRFNGRVLVEGEVYVSIPIGAGFGRFSHRRGSGSNTLVFGHQVGAGDFDNDGLQSAWGNSRLGSGNLYGIWTNGAYHREDVAPRALPEAFSSTHRVDGYTMVESVQVTSSPADGTAYRAGETIELTATFDQEVEIDGAVGLSLWLNHNDESTWRGAWYQSGSGSKTLVFAYEVVVSDRDDDGLTFSRGRGDRAGHITSGFTGSGTIKTENTDAHVNPNFSGARNISDQRVDGRPYIKQVAISSAPSSGGDTYIKGETVQVSLSFSQAVETSGAVTVRLLLHGGRIGDKEVDAVYESGNESETLVFGYEVGGSDEDGNGIAVAAGSETSGFGGSGTIRAAGTTVAFNPTHPGLADADRHKVDGVAPFVEAFALLSDTGEGEVYTLGDWLGVLIVWSEEVLVVGSPQLELDFDGVPKTATHGVVRDGLPALTPFVLLVGYYVALGDQDGDGFAIGPNKLSLNGGSIKDRGGNDALLSHPSVGPNAFGRVRAPNRGAAFSVDDNALRTVAENTAAGSKIDGRIAATDAENDSLTYSMLGDDAAAFELDPSTGQLRTRLPLDHEAQGRYAFTVMVHDGKDSYNDASSEIDDTIDMTVEVSDVDEPPEVSGEAQVSIEENSSDSVGGYRASDPEGQTTTWAALAGADAGRFELTDSGELRFKEAPDFEARADANHDNRYEVRVGASDGLLPGRLDVIVTVTNVNEPPIITGDASPSLEEAGTLLVGTYGASDPEGATIAWQPLGGADGGKFEFNVTNGRLTFKAAPDFEDATRGGDNEYSVTLGASAGGQTTTLEIAVTVTNKDEGGTLSLSSPQPQADADYAATLSDPDGVQSTDWTWERSTSRNGPWTPVTSVTSSVTTSVYTPVADDVGYYLRATAAYDDGHSANKSLVAVSVQRVRAAPVVNVAPSFSEASPNRDVAESARSGAAVGDPVTATDPDVGDTLTYEFESPGSELFTIDGNSGQIRVKLQGALDYETARSHTVTVIARDSSNELGTVQVSIEVTDVNEPPDAVPDAPDSFDEDTATTIDVLANDSDPEDDGSELLLTVVSSPLNGRATVNAPENLGHRRTITYLPNANYHGSDTFRYEVQDSGSPSLSSTATVSVEVRAVNDAPTFGSPTTTRSVSERAGAGDSVGRPVTAMEIDEGDALTYSLSGADGLSFSIDAEGQIKVGTGVTFDAATKSEYAVTVEARDRAGASATVEVAITVTTGPPIITRDGGSGARGAGGGGGGGGGGGPPPKPVPSDADFDWNVTRDIEEFDNRNDGPTGLWSDGEVLFILENAASGADSVFAYDLESEERNEDREFELDRRNRFSHGIWSDGVTVWVADSGQDQLFAYDLESGERDEAREFELAERNRDPRGIWSDRKVIYVLDSVKDALFLYDLESGDLMAEHALDKLNRSPRGIWSDEVTIWVSDDGAKRLFAYEFEDETLQRNEDLEFTFRSLLKAGNGNPRGIWSDGDIMYVVDEQDDKVYTYNLPDAIIALLSSLTLSGIELTEFSPGRVTYTTLADASATVTTVEAIATQEAATAVIAPTDADADGENGHQIALDAVTEITITVTSIDGSRTKSYRVLVEKPPCLTGLTAERLSEVTFAGGSLDDLERCAREQGVAAFFYWTGAFWLLWAPDAPGFLSRQFRSTFEDGVPVGASFIAATTGDDTTGN